MDSTGDLLILGHVQALFASGWGQPAGSPIKEPRAHSALVAGDHATIESIFVATTVPVVASEPFHHERVLE